jgi:CubicO group peptidase (beta-lactamase class C family)/D-alanyl-D-alanine dipeptidase
MKSGEEPAASGRGQRQGVLLRVAAALAVLAVASTSQSEAQPVVGPLDPYAEVARRLEPWIAAEVDSKALPALSIALVDGERIVWARGFGFADRERTVPATADMVGRVGSVSKLFTDLAVMQLVEQGKLELDAPVSRVLPEFAPRNPYQVPITLRHLLSHRAGLVREPPVGHYFDPDPPALTDVVKSLSGTTLIHQPGTRTKYSNAGVTVAGAMVERVRGEPFAKALGRMLLEPLGMSRSSFEPAPALKRDMAHGLMWSYDGQAITTPTFLLGTGPASNLVSTVIDLGRFVSALFAGGRGTKGAVVAPETIRLMTEPQLGREGESPAFGLGFALSKLENERCIGHGGAVYGFATEVLAMPDAKLGAIVIATADCANGVAGHIARTALRLTLAARRRTPLDAVQTAALIPPARARELDGHYVHGDQAVDLIERNGRLFLAPFAQELRVQLRALGDSLVVDDRLSPPATVVVDGPRITLGQTSFDKQSVAKPGAGPERWDGLIGEYGWDHDVLYILEKSGRLHALVEWFFAYPLTEEGPDRFRFPSYGLYSDEALVFERGAGGGATQVAAAGVVFRRRRLDGEDGKTFRIKPRQPVEAIRGAVQLALPPGEPGTFRAPELVELVKLDATIRLDIRYATANNFLGVPIYTSARAFMQRPAAEALVRAHHRLAEKGYGLLIHDAYRPWQVTKLFWEATPDSGRIFVADPAKGSKHNRGAAVDLTLYDRTTGGPVRMVGGYDEFSPRSNPDYPGGRALERWHRELLRRAMEAEGFTVNEVEWWHFDHRDWPKYPIINRRFEELSGDPGAN